MLPTKLKKTAGVDMYTKLENYVLGNYNTSLISDNVQSFFRDIKQNRDVMTKLCKNETNQEQLIQHRSILTTYLNEILTLKSKMTFGKQSYSCKIGFVWTDIICSKEWKSYNIYFEIYNCLFNLGVLYFKLGDSVAKNVSDDDKDKNKERDKSKNREAVKYFKQALYIFDRLRNTAYSAISSKELPYDLYPNYLKYLCKICIIYGQIEIVEVAQKMPNQQNTLQAQLCLGISESFKSAAELSTVKPTSKAIKEEFREFLFNRVQYFRGMMYQKLREASVAKFDKEGVGYGDALTFQGKLVSKLLVVQKSLEKCKNYIDVKAFNNKLKAEKELGQKMLDLNTRIYHQSTKGAETFKVNSKFLLTPLLPEDLYIGKNKEKAKENGENICPELDTLIPEQVKDMIDRYKQKMGDFLQQNISQYETEKTVSTFLNNLHLPAHLTKRRTGENLNTENILFPNELWEKISHVQKLGGTMALNNIMQEIKGKYDYMVSNLQNTLNSFKNEESDDNAMRQKYGNKWLRKPSNALNTKYILAIQNHLNNLDKTVHYDTQQVNDICNNAKYFEKISCSKDKLIKDIPGKINKKKPENDKETEIHEEILNLLDLSDKTSDIISPIYEQLNDDTAVMSMFIEVLEKTTTEQAIFNKNKEEYEKKFVELKEISEQILNQKKVITELSAKLLPELMKKNSNENFSEDALNYFNELDKYANLYLNMYDKCKKGEDYYNNLQYKVDELLAASNQWMIKRNEEKNILVNTITKGKLGGNMYQNQTSFMNPNQNMYTNFNVNHKGF